VVSRVPIKGGLDTQDVQDPVEAAKTIGLDTFLGGLAGLGVGALASRAGQGLSMVGRADTGIREGRLAYTDPINTAAQAKEIDSLTKLAEQGSSETFLYPGGANRQALASVRSMFSDRYAFLEDWNSWRLAMGVDLPSGDMYRGSRLMAGLDAKVASNVHRQLGGILASAGVTQKNMPAYYEHLNRLLQADWAKDGYFFIHGVTNQAEADAALQASRAAVDKLRDLGRPEEPVDQGAHVGAVGSGSRGFQTDYSRMVRLQTMIERQRVMNSLDALAQATPNEFGKFFVDEGRAVQHTAIQDSQLEGRGVQSNLYGPSPPATSTEGLTDVYRRHQPDAQLFVREAAEGMRVPEGWQTIPVWKGGVAHIYRAPDWFADSVMGWNRYDADKFGNFLGGITNAPFFRKAVTMWSLPFVVNNIFRDIGDVAKNVSVGALGPYHQGLFEAATHATGIAAFYERHGTNPVVTTFPERLAVALKPAYEAIEKGILGVDAAGNPIRTLPQYMGSGAGMATFTEDVMKTHTPVEALNLARGEPVAGTMSPLAPIGYLGEKVAGAMNPLNWFDGGMKTLETVAQTTELAPRLGVFRWAMDQPGTTAAQAAMIARNATVDFSKAGYVSAAMNKILPLFNPRIQGELRNVQAMWEDPAGWQVRSFVGSVSPPWRSGRSSAHVLGDDVNKIPQRLLDNNYVIPLGKWTDEQGDSHPVVIPIRKDPIAALISTPLEHFLNMHYNLTQGDRPLRDDQRNRRSVAQILVDDLR
jgi:hypothetical protein